jgi:hypothetical protein
MHKAFQIRIYPTKKQTTLIHKVRTGFISILGHVDECREWI